MERAEVSKRNKYYISKHRYYELKHFCLQYSEWTKAVRMLNAWDKAPNDFVMVDSKNKTPANPTEKLATAKVYFSTKIDLVEQALSHIEPSITPFVRIGVTQGLPYDTLRARGCPCGRDMYYNEYRKFFWYLNIIKG